MSKVTDPVCRYDHQAKSNDQLKCDSNKIDPSKKKHPNEPDWVTAHRAGESIQGAIVVQARSAGGIGRASTKAEGYAYQALLTQLCDGKTSATTQPDAIYSTKIEIDNAYPRGIIPGFAGAQRYIDPTQSNTVFMMFPIKGGLELICKLPPRDPATENDPVYQNLENQLEQLEQPKKSADSGPTDIDGGVNPKSDAGATKDHEVDAKPDQGNSDSGITSQDQTDDLKEARERYNPEVNSKSTPSKMLDDAYRRLKEYNQEKFDENNSAGNDDGVRALRLRKSTPGLKAVQSLQIRLTYQGLPLNKANPLIVDITVQVYNTKFPENPVQSITEIPAKKLDECFKEVPAIFNALLEEAAK
jgi:hypothetical protein